MGGTGAWGVAVADLNGDGKMDIVVPNSIDVGTVSILLGNGDGTLKAHVDYPSGGRGPLWVGVGDLNGDGSLDLVVSNFNRYGSSSTVSVLLGKGDGTFSVGGSYTTGPDPHEGVLADFNGDGKLDLALTIQDSRNIWVFLGNGDGTFQPYVSFATPFGPTNLIAGDFNDDGKLDLAHGELRLWHAGGHGVPAAGQRRRYVSCTCELWHGSDPDRGNLGRLQRGWQARFGDSQRKRQHGLRPVAGYNPWALDHHTEVWRSSWSEPSAPRRR